MTDQSEVDKAISAYDTLGKECETLKAQLEAKLKERSDAVRHLAALTGSNGPFTVNGQEVKVVVRGETYFFKRSRGSSKAA
jgi:hypothetical protein